MCADKNIRESERIEDCVNCLEPGQQYTKCCNFAICLECAFILINESDGKCVNCHKKIFIESFNDKQQVELAELEENFQFEQQKMRDWFAQTKDINWRINVSHKDLYDAEVKNTTLFYESLIRCKEFENLGKYIQSLTPYIFKTPGYIIQMYDRASNTMIKYVVSYWYINWIETHHNGKFFSNNFITYELYKNYIKPDCFYGVLEQNDNITLDIMKNNKEVFDGSYGAFTLNNNVTFDYMKKHKDKNWSHSVISTKPNITIDDINNNFYGWNYREIILFNSTLTFSDINNNEYLSSYLESNYLNIHTRITWDNIKKHPRYNTVNALVSLLAPWDYILGHVNGVWARCHWTYVSCNKQITFDIIYDTREKYPWEIKYVCRNINVNWDIVQKHPDYPWNYMELSENPNITLQIALAHPEYSWNYYALCINPLSIMPLSYLIEYK
jgi:hypothetical protein